MGTGKTYAKISARLIVLLLPFFLVIPIAVSQFPMQFMDGEYPYYLQNKEFAENSDENPRVLILGDSVAKAAWLPEELGKDVYNFALGGASPLEEYYCLYSYLQTHVAPQYVVYTQGIRHFYELDTFWSRSMYFHRIGMQEAKEIEEATRDFEDRSLFETDDIIREARLYQMYAPMKYGEAFIKGILLSRGKQNAAEYAKVVASRGQMQFGTAEQYDELNVYVDLEKFATEPILDFYFRKVIDLCGEYGIRFVFQNAPMNESSYKALHETFIEGYEGYLEKIAKDYPQAIVDRNLFYYSNDMFGDSMHVNVKGTHYFSQQMKKKYCAIFENG